MSKCLSLFDVTGIQRYVFAGNRLRAHLGASWQVEQALDGCLKEAAAAASPQSTWLWAGGGNAMVASVDVKHARAVATELSRRLTRAAPGLNVACAHSDWDEAPATFAAASAQLHEALAATKAGTTPPAGFDGAGVTALSADLGAPAVEHDAKIGWVDASTRAKLAASDAAEKRLQALAVDLGPDLVWTNNFDELGRTSGDRSILGVVHFDGNGIGRRFREEADTLAKLSALSQQVNKAGARALSEALVWLASRLPGITDVRRGGFPLTAVRTSGKSTRFAFPVRPILYGGDDVTLVCDGRIALDLAARLLAAWRTASADLPGGAAHACAGVALVPSHFPFHRAHELSEALCQSAKRYVRDTLKHDASALDWQVIGAGVVEPLARLRAAARASSDEALAARPYIVDGPTPPNAPYRAWSWFNETLLRSFQEDDDRHTQIKGLAEALRGGASVAGEHLSRWRDRFGFGLPAHPQQPTDQAGFANQETPYLDAIELMDRCIPRALLEPVGQKRDPS